MLLSIEAIKVHYGKVEAVKGISLDIEEGKIITLIGANGAGKTTVLRTIAGLKNPTSGKIWFDGKRIERSKTAQIVKMGIAHVPERDKIFPDMSVLENLMMGAYLRHDGKAIKQDLEQVYEHFPRLKERKKQRAGSLSGGEQQMLAIGRALLCQPKLLLMDEPSMGLSPLLTQEIGEIIATINSSGVAIILAEQHIAMALKLADKGYVMETGRIVLQGDRRELLSNADVKKHYLGL